MSGPASTTVLSAATSTAVWPSTARLPSVPLASRLLAAAARTWCLHGTLAPAYSAAAATTTILAASRAALPRSQARACQKTTARKKLRPVLESRAGAKKQTNRRQLRQRQRRNKVQALLRTPKQLARPAQTQRQQRRTLARRCRASVWTARFSILASLGQAMVGIQELFCTRTSAKTFATGLLQTAARQLHHWLPHRRRRRLDAAQHRTSFTASRPAGCPPLLQTFCGWRGTMGMSPASQNKLPLQRPSNLLSTGMPSVTMAELVLAESSSILQTADSIIARQGKLGTTMQ